jgi:hypothetical protein
MGVIAAERAKRFTRDVVVPKLERFYYDAVDLHRARA